MNEFVAIDLPALIAALLALLACGTLGNWLVLRKEAMTGDAIAHAVLPGLVAGYLVAGTHSAPAMLGGAAVAGVAAVLLAGWVRRRTDLEPGAALGTVFTAFFALGVTLLETGGARQVDLDPGCVLFGSLETMFVVRPESATGVAGWLRGLPREVWTLAAAALAAVSFHCLFAKELALLAFDREHARTTGAAPRWLEHAMLCVTSMAIVASFEAVGSILVIALIACPSLIAAPHARSVGTRLALGLALGSVLATAGYLLAAHAPSVFGTAHALNAAGMIAMLLALAVPCSFGVRALVSRRSA